MVVTEVPSILGTHLAPKDLKGVRSPALQNAHKHPYGPKTASAFLHRNH